MYHVEEALLREPNLWVPGKKPILPVRLDTGNTGVIMDQWIGPHIMSSGVIGEIDTAVIEPNAVRTTDEANYGGLTFKSGLSHIITSRPYGCFAQSVPTGVQSTTGKYIGKMGRFRNTSSSPSRCYFGHKSFKDNLPSLYTGQGFNTTFSQSSPLTDWRSDGVMVTACVSYSETDHRAYVLWSNGTLDIMTNTTDLSDWDEIFFDSLSVGHTRMKNNGVGAKSSLHRFFTAGALSGSGLTEEWLLDFMRDVYKYLVPA